jgi:hypothetical protein
VTTLPGVFWAVLAAALIHFPRTAAQPPEDGLLFGESFTLAARETYSGNLVAVDSALTLAEGSVFEGNIILAGGSLESAGAVVGDIACVGAYIHFASTAIVRGNVVCIGAAPVVDSGAGISGSLDSVEGILPPFSAATVSGPGTDAGRVNIGYEITVVLFRMFLLSAVAVLIVLFFPSPARRVTRTIVAKPAVSFLIGLLTMTAAIALFLLLAITVCLSPISLLGSAVLLVAVLLGWSSMGWQIGRQLFGLLRARAHPAVTAGIGTAVLTLAASGLGYIPFAGLVLIGLGLSYGLGAVVLTRFGGPDNPILPEGTPSDSSPA